MHDGWVTFTPAGTAVANAMMPGLIFKSHGVFVTDSKAIREKLLMPLRRNQAMMYRQYNPGHDGEIKAYLEAPGSNCVIDKCE